MQNRLDGENTAPDRGHARSQLEEALDRLCAPLLQSMSEEERAGLRDEMEAHIGTLAAAHEELGLAPIEAMRAALQQFGDPKRIGRAIRKERRVTSCRMRYARFGQIAATIAAAWHIGPLGANLAVYSLDWSMRPMHPIVCGGAMENFAIALAGLIGLFIWRRALTLRQSTWTGAMVHATFVTVWVLVGHWLQTGRPCWTFGAAYWSWWLAELSSYTVAGAGVGAAMATVRVLLCRILAYNPRSCQNLP